MVMDTSTKWLYERAISYMTQPQRDWRRLTAKSRGFEQSLFDHTRIEIDALLQLVPIFSRTNHFGLTEDELEILIVALMAHDMGKQLDEWQDYIGGRSDPLSDVNRRLTAEVVPTLYPALGLEPREGVNQVIENCINLHMRHERRPGNVLDAILGARGSRDRWFSLAEIVYHLDNLCSIGSVSGVLDYLRDESKPFYRHLHSVHHQLSVRGVSTPILHRAAEETFEEKGWIPLLYFRDATIYVKSAVEPKEQPTQEDVQARFAQILQENLQSEVARLMVGDPRQDILPKPDLFDCQELDDYLHMAYRKMSSRSFSNKSPGERRKRVASYLSVEQSDVDAETLERETDRISQAQPEMIVFKFFKAAMSKAMVGDDGFRRTAALYEEAFDHGMWDGLQSTSTIMPVKDTVGLFISDAAYFGR
jgi:hypothetical protein